jgi:hypothetical protein
VARVDNLKPFNPETASLAGKRSAEARRAKALAQRAADANNAREAAEHLATFTQAFPRDSMGPNAAAIGNYILSRIALGLIPIRHAADAAELLKVVVDIARLEEGQATSHTLHASIDSAAIVARIEQLRHELGTPPAAIEASSDQG